MTFIYQQLTLPFSSFCSLPSSLERSGTRATRAHLLVGSPSTKARGQPRYNKMLLLSRQEFKFAEPPLSCTSLVVNKLNPYITNSSACSHLSFIAYT